MCRGAEWPPAAGAGKAHNQLMAADGVTGLETHVPCPNAFACSNWLNDRSPLAACARQRVQPGVFPAPPSNTEPRERQGSSRSRCRPMGRPNSAAQPYVLPPALGGVSNTTSVYVSHATLSL